MSTARDHSIYERLGHLAGYATVPDFAQAFYELIADYVSVAENSRVDVQALFLDYLTVEERYHACLSSLVAEDATAIRGVRDATEKREIAMRSLLEMLDGQRVSGQAEVARVLLCAECYYHLGLTERVVERLEVAVSHGASHPLVHFALGYNRFQLANQVFTALDPTSGAVQVHDEDRYRLACLNAVNAFQQGLCGEPFDGQLHWWIGNVLRAAGFGDAADASLRQAAEFVGAELEWDDDTDPFAVEEVAGDADGDLGPITTGELDEVAALLRRAHLPPDLN